MAQKKSQQKRPVILLSLQSRITDELIVEQSVKYCHQAMNLTRKLKESDKQSVSNCLNTYLIALKAGDSIMAEGK